MLFWPGGGPSTKFVTPEPQRSEARIATLQRAGLQRVCMLYTVKQTSIACPLCHLDAEHLIELRRRAATMFCIPGLIVPGLDAKATHARSAPTLRRVRYSGSATFRASSARAAATRALACADRFGCHPYGCFSSCAAGMMQCLPSSTFQASCGLHGGYGCRTWSRGVDRMLIARDGFDCAPALRQQTAAAGLRAWDTTRWCARSHRCGGAISVSASAVASRFPANNKQQHAVSTKLCAPARC